MTRYYRRLEAALGPVEPLSTAILVGVAVVCLLVAWRGDAAVKAALAAWVLAP